MPEQISKYHELTQPFERCQIVSMNQPKYDPNWRHRLYRDLLEPIFLHFGLFILGLLAVAALLIMLFKKMFGE